MEFDDFYRDNYRHVHRAMTLTFQDPVVADEITQEAFYRALRRWPKVSKLGRPDAWTMVVALNCGRDASRRAQHHRSKAPLLLEGETSRAPETDIDDRMAIVALLSSVSDRQREVLVLRYIAQMTVPEMAKALKCAQGTVKSTLHAALENAFRATKGTPYVQG
jgi:RNA polymerase sigma factor (sigma-70 family)